VRVQGKMAEQCLPLVSLQKETTQIHKRALIALPLLQRCDRAIPCNDCLSRTASFFAPIAVDTKWANTSHLAKNFYMWAIRFCGKKRPITRHIFCPKISKPIPKYTTICFTISYNFQKLSKTIEVSLVLFKN